MAKEKKLNNTEDEVIEVSLNKKSEDKQKSENTPDSFLAASNDKNKKSYTLVDQGGLMLDNDLINLTMI